MRIVQVDAFRIRAAYGIEYATFDFKEDRRERLVFHDVGRVHGEMEERDIL